MEFNACDVEWFKDTIEWYLNDSDKALHSVALPALEAEGFKCREKEESYCERFETGFHPGQNDDPRDVEKWLQKEMPEHEFIFVINSSGQFDVKWSVYIRKEEQE